MDVATVGIDEQAGDSIGGNSGWIQELRVRCTRLESWHYGHTGPYLVTDLFERTHDLRGERRRLGSRTADLRNRDFETRIGYDAGELIEHRLARDSGKDAAVDVGLRTLRQRVCGVACRQHGRYTRCTQHRVQTGI